MKNKILPLTQQDKKKSRRKDFILKNRIWARHSTIERKTQ